MKAAVQNSDTTVVLTTQSLETLLGTKINQLAHWKEASDVKSTISCGKLFHTLITL